MTVVSFSMAYRSFPGGSGRLDTRLDTPPSINRRHPDSCLARRRGSAAGRQSRSSTYPPALCFVHLPRRAIAMALMLALLVVEAEPVPDPGRRFGNARIGVSVHLLILQAAPQPLDEDVVHAAALA